MPNIALNNYKATLVAGTGINPLTDTIKCALFTTALTPVATQVYYSDIIASEASGTGYTAGGNTLTGKTVTTDNTLNRGVFSAANVTFSSVTVSNVRYAAIYKSTGVSTTSPLMVIIDLGVQSVNGADFTVQFDTAGVLYTS